MRAEMKVVVGLDVGSGRTKMEVVEMDAAGAIVRTLFTRHEAVFFADDFACNGHDKLSDEIMERGYNILKEYKKTADDLGATYISGAATQVFRLASNGHEFLKKVNAELGVNLRVVSQDCEGQIGFLTAKSVLSTSVEDENIIAYDSGAGSFQITYLTRGDEDDMEGDSYDEHGVPAVTVYGGHWGSVPAREALMVQIRKASKLEKNNDPHPVSREEMDALVDYIFSQLHEPPKQLSAILEGKSDLKIVGIGEETSLFCMVKNAIGLDEFTQDDVSRALDVCADKYTSYFKERNYGESFQVVPKLCLLLAVMRKFNMKKVSSTSICACMCVCMYVCELDLCLCFIFLSFDPFFSLSFGFAVSVEVCTYYWRMPRSYSS
eukprot:m.69778 g.69778  ORF g.69778 m.69778 type:complete len:378 (-) comp11646_c3_seq2:1652-2785(-)